MMGIRVGIKDINGIDIKVGDTIKKVDCVDKCCWIVRFEEIVANINDRRETNAYTESINNIIKSVEKEGKGYSFEVLRAKVLYGTTATKRPKFKRDMNFRSFNMMLDSSLYYEGFEVDLNELQTHLGGNSNE